MLKATMNEQKQLDLAQQQQQNKQKDKNRRSETRRTLLKREVENISLGFVQVF
jgi:hypothetical protein